MPDRINAEYGIAIRGTDAVFGYFGWPSVAKMPDGRLIVVCSGFRLAHVCPFGKTAAAISNDGGKHWSLPSIASDTPLDDRDAGVITLPDGRVAITWFTNSIAFQRSWANASWQEPKHGKLMNAYLDMLSPQDEADNLGSFIRYSDDCGESFGPKVKIPISSPHGFTVLSDGTLFYLGKPFDGFTKDEPNEEPDKRVTAMSSKDGYTWQMLGRIPLSEGFTGNHFQEPHSIELKNGDILALIRVENHLDYPFSTFKSISKDRGLTWSVPVPTGLTGAPPHLLRHSSGKIICSYAQRNGADSCEKAAISDDEGETWSDYIIDDRSQDRDLGYPCSTELDDGSILTVYYQRLAGDKNTSILTAHWKLKSLL